MLARLRTALLLLPLLVLAAPATAQQPTGFLDRTATLNGDSIPYQVFVPRSYRADMKWPVILFLHGAGERGADGLKQTQVGIGLGLRFHSDRYPAIVVLPQCPTGQRWADRPAELAMKALDQTLAEFSCDPGRVYLTGLSMGGFGSWLLAAKYPERFAAVVPICGGGDPSKAAMLAGIPIWVWHGDQDAAVPVARSREMVEAIKKAGGEKVRYTELPGVGHNSWDAAYTSKELTDWLFAQRR